MARYKETEKKQGHFIPVIFDEQIIPGTIEHAICDIIDNHVDLSEFDGRYKNDSTGAPAIPPAILLKIILVCYSKGIIHSRKMERAVETNIQLMAIAEGLAPDHSTLAGFVSSLGKDIKRLFVEVLIRCAQLDLVGGEVFALDGCKISSNASKEYSGTFKELEKKKKKLAIVLEKLMQKQLVGEIDADQLEERKNNYQDKIAKIDEFLKTHEPKKGSRGRELKSNVTDNESAKMKSSHGVIQGYNGMAVADDKSQIVVAAEAFGQGQEGNLLAPMMEQAEANLAQTGKSEGMEGKAVLADTNYFSEENVRYCDDKKMDAYIPDQYFRNRDPRFPDNYPRRQALRKNLYSRQDFTFDEKQNCFTCPAGKLLYYKQKANIHGYRGRLYYADPAGCRACLLSPKCLKKNAIRRSLFIVDVPKPKTFSERMIEKIDTPLGREMYSRRMGIVEPVFANITVHKGLNKFTLRTKEKVNIQWLLFCLVHNIGKIARYFLSLARLAVFFYFFRLFFIGAALTSPRCDQK
jgi:transposase